MEGVPAIATRGSAEGKCIEISRARVAGVNWWLSSYEVVRR